MLVTTQDKATSANIAISSTLTGRSVRTRYARFLSGQALSSQAGNLHVDQTSFEDANGNPDWTRGHATTVALTANTVANFHVEAAGLYARVRVTNASGTVVATANYALNVEEPV